MELSFHNSPCAVNSSYGQSSASGIISNGSANNWDKHAYHFVSAICFQNKIISSYSHGFREMNLHSAVSYSCFHKKTWILTHNFSLHKNCLRKIIFAVYFSFEQIVGAVSSFKIDSKCPSSYSH